MDMASTMTIGAFSRATQLSAKTLRFYHRVGLLEPAAVDPSNGYRLYRADQISDAQVIRRLRALSVPVGTIKDILETSSLSNRNRLIGAHVERLEAELETTRAAVRSLRGLLDEPSTPLKVEYRSVPALPALVISETIELPDLSEWYTSARDELDEYARSRAPKVVGPRRGIWSTDLFLEERGSATLLYPLLSHGGVAPSGRIRTESLPPVDLAVAVHRGPDETIGQTYGALGAYVAEHELGIDGPIHETYLVDASLASPDVVTEIGWPIFRTGR